MLLTKIYICDLKGSAVTVMEFWMTVKWPAIGLGLGLGHNRFESHWLSIFF
jgi:hypothetical protein